MKEIIFKVVNTNHEAVDLILIDSFSALADYEVFCNHWADSAISGIIASGLDVDKFDHYHITPHSGWHMACVFAKMSGANPIYTVRESVQEKIINMRDSLADGNTILVNSNAGYSYMDDSVITNTRDVSANDIVKTATVVEEAVVLVLENDPILPFGVKAAADKLFNSYSVVCCLRHYSESELYNIMLQHREIFVQTTAMDIEQLKSYVKTAIDANIEKITFDFIADVDHQVFAFLGSIAGEIKIEYTTDD